jgi:hypothetical protein
MKQNRKLRHHPQAVKMWDGEGDPHYTPRGLAYSPSRNHRTLGQCRRFTVSGDLRESVKQLRGGHYPDAFVGPKPEQVPIPGDYGRRTGEHGALEDPVVGLVSENSELDIGLYQGFCCSHMGDE